MSPLYPAYKLGSLQVFLPAYTADYVAEFLANRQAYTEKGNFNYLKRSANPPPYLSAPFIPDPEGLFGL